jgi:hypothetical protein
METGSTKPQTSPARVDSAMVELALATRDFFDTHGTEIITHPRPPKGALRGWWGNDSVS